MNLLRRLFQKRAGANAVRFAAKADEVIKLPVKSDEKLRLESLHVALSPVTAMTDWLAADTAPHGFTVDQVTELCASGEGKATVRYIRHTLEAADVGRHIAAGKQCTCLAPTWADKISFVLTESLTVKRATPLDVIREKADSTAQSDDERFDSDMAFMTGEVFRLIADLVHAFGDESGK